MKIKGPKDYHSSRKKHSILRSLFLKFQDVINNWKTSDKVVSNTKYIYLLEATP